MTDSTNKGGRKTKSAGRGRTAGAGASARTSKKKPSVSFDAPEDTGVDAGWVYRSASAASGSAAGASAGTSAAARTARHAVAPDHLLPPAHGTASLPPPEESAAAANMLKQSQGVESFLAVLAVPFELMFTTLFSVAGVTPRRPGPRVK